MAWNFVETQTTPRGGRGFNTTGEQLFTGDVIAVRNNSYDYFTIGLWGVVLLEQVFPPAYELGVVCFSQLVYTATLMVTYTGGDTGDEAYFSIYVPKTYRDPEVSWSFYKWVPGS